MQGKAGQLERGIEQEGIAADKAAFEEERDFPYRQVQYMQSLLKGLPLAAQSYSYAQPSPFSNVIGSGGILDLLKGIFGGGEEAEGGGEEAKETN